jgi:hypothetical protein
MSELIEGADDEGVEGVARVQVVSLVDIEAREVERGIFLRWALSLFPTRFSCGPVDYVFDRANGVIEGSEGSEDEFVVLIHQPFFNDFRWNSHGNSVSVA